MKNLIAIILAALFAFPADAVLAGSGPQPIPYSFLGAANGVPQLDVSAKLPASAAYPNSQRVICSQNFGYGSAGLSPTGGTYGETDRIEYECTVPVSRLYIGITNTYSSSADVQNATAVFHSATLEYGSSLTPRNFTVGGQAAFVLDAASPYVVTDPLAQVIHANTPFYIRFFSAVPAPPSAISSAVSSGGSLSVGTHYYKATCVVPTGHPGEYSLAESSASSETSATTSSGNQTITVTLTNNSSTLGCPAAYIYSGTSTGTETLLAQVTNLTPYAGTSQTFTYTDTGAVANSAIAVPSTTYNRYPIRRALTSADYTNAAWESGVGTDTTASPGTSGMASIPTNNPGQATGGPDVLYADSNAKSNATCILGDSRAYGKGVQPNTGPITDGSVTGYGSNFGNWFDQSLPFGAYDTLNTGISGSVLEDVVGARNSTNSLAISRVALIEQGCKYVVLELGINDIHTFSASWQTVATEQLQVAKEFYQVGMRPIFMTLEPAGASTDNGILIANYSPYATESNRVSYNDWVRAGAQVVGGTPVLSGGTASPYMYAYYDMAKAVGEVNASGVATVDGGYWPAGVSVGSGTASGSPTTTSIPYSAISGVGTVANHTLAGYVIKFTSGAASGQSCTISDNSTTGPTITCNGAAVSGTNLTTAPASGDTFTVYKTSTTDGLHQSIFGNANTATGSNAFGYTNFSTWAASNLVPY